MSDPMHIVQLTVENVKRIRAVTIDAGDVVVLSGRNAQGKTSVLDAIWLALGGAKAKRERDGGSPIRDGADTATVRIDLGELVVEREWKQVDGGDVTTKLRVTNADGHSLSSPQTILDALLSHAGFDPLAFTRMSPREQASALTDLVELPFDPAKYDAETKRLYDERTNVNRDAEKMAASLDSYPRYPNAPKSLVDANDLLDEIRAIRTRLDERRQAEAKLDQLADEKRRTQERIDELVATLTLAQGRLRELDDAAELVAHAIQQAPDESTKLAELEEQLADVGSINEKVMANERYEMAGDALVQTRAQADGLTAQIEERRRQRKIALSAAAFPVEGLGFDESGEVTYRDLPFSQASAAEQVEVSTAIAMAGSPRLRVVTIRDASLLDSEHLAIITRMAAERDYQLWLEKVDESGAVGIVIEDGAVRAAS